MKHLILLAFYFPPDGGGGSQRPASIVQHARDAGWRVTAVTRPAEAARNMWNPEDHSLHAAPVTAAAVRVPMPEGSAAGEMFPRSDDALDPWLSRVAERIEQVHRADPASAVLVTMPPYGLCGIVPELKRRLPQVPVIVDLRDPWALDGALSYASRSQWRRNLRWMTRTFASCDAVVANTPESGECFTRMEPGVEPARLAVVPNGFEPADFTGPTPTIPAKYVDGRFHLVHTGTLHSQALLKRRGIAGRLREIKGYRAEPIDVAGRTALPLLKAIRRLRDANHPGIDELSLVLVGIDDAATARLVSESGVSDLVTLTGYLPHDQSVAWLRWAQCLFLPLHGLPRGYRSLIVPGKTYEYLATGKPILGALPQGDARDLVERSGRGFCADPCDPAQIAAALGRVLSLHRDGQRHDAPPLPWVQEYQRGALVRRLFEFIDAVAAQVEAPAEVSTS